MVCRSLLCGMNACDHGGDDGDYDDECGSFGEGQWLEDWEGL